MFPNSAKARAYKEAIAVLEKMPDDKLLWLHDYDSPVYRDPKKKDYSVNGLHWGYPDLIAQETSKIYWDANAKNADPTPYARFVTKANSAPTSQFAQNSRYKKVPFGEIRVSILMTLNARRAEAAEKAKEEAKVLKAWLSKVKKEYPKLVPHTALRIEHAPEGLRFVSLNPERFTLRGFGYFLEGVKKGEVSIAPEARKVLAKIPARRGLMGAEFFETPDGPIIAGLFGLSMVLPLDAISVNGLSLQDMWKRKLAVEG